MMILGIFLLIIAAAVLAGVYFLDTQDQIKALEKVQAEEEFVHAREPDRVQKARIP